MDNKNGGTKASGGIKGFWKGVKTEFRKIIWPDGPTLVKQTIAVVCVVVVVGILIAVVDLGAQYIVDWITTLGA